MRITIERIRTLVLVAGGLLLVALVAFLAIGRWKSHFNFREIPKRLGVNIQQEANGVTYTQARSGHTLFKIHASKVVQLKEGGRALLHDVQIELYGEDGSRVDRISGDEFEYDQNNGTATAAGPVEITLMRPGLAAPATGAKPRPALREKMQGSAVPVKTPSSSDNQIHVKTSGLTFDQRSGVATTAQPVEFAIAQGNGSSVGATFDSVKGELVLDHAVDLSIQRGHETVLLRAQHAEFERGDLLCRMKEATASFRGGEASAGDASVLFRPDGSAIRLDASDGFSVKTAHSAEVRAPRAALEFDERNQPRHGLLADGTTLDSDNNGRKVHATAPIADLDFTALGELHHAHLERGVVLHSEQTSSSADEEGGPLHVTRDWHSQVADIEFHDAGKGKVEVAAVHGTGGVVINGQTQRGSGPMIPSRMTADDLAASFGPGQILSAMVGKGHASLEETTGAGTHQTIAGDRVEANFTKPSSGRPGKEPKPGTTTEPGPATAAAQIQNATVEGHVSMVQLPPAKPGTPAVPLRATAGRATYEAAGEWLHLTASPRVDDGGLQLTAEKVDVSRASGDAFAHGDVKATWIESAASKPSEESRSHPASLSLGGQGPAHVIADEAQLHQPTGEATFHGHARLWQQANSIAAPVIELDRTQQTLVAHTTVAADPVRIVLLSASTPAAMTGESPSAEPRGGTAKAASPSVIRMHGGDLKYSAAERKAVVQAGIVGSVTTETATATATSNEVEVLLLPPGNHAGKDGSAAQVDRLIATGHVVLNSEGRRGTGEQLVYSSETGEYALTGTAADPPRMTQAGRGTVSGETLIFNTRDDSVSIEGGGRKTTTETYAPERTSGHYRADAPK